MKLSCSCLHVESVACYPTHQELDGSLVVSTDRLLPVTSVPLCLPGKPNETYQTCITNADLRCLISSFLYPKQASLRWSVHIQVSLVQHTAEPAVLSGKERALTAFRSQDTQASSLPAHGAHGGALLGQVAPPELHPGAIKGPLTKHMTAQVTYDPG